MTLLRPKREPMLLRTGARFSCEGDGLCCSDVHAVGPLNEEDIVFLASISEEAIDRHEDEDAAVLMMRSDTGTCVFWSEGGCALHAKLGPEMKPSPCIQFPYGLTATPTGGRITTQHRCPCRTLGTRAPVSVDAARPCILGSDAEPKPDHAVEEPIAWSNSESVPFSEYERRESAVIESLVEGQNLARRLAAEPFPKLERLAWTQVADEFREFSGPSRVAAAARWFGDALGYLIDRRERTERDRPWASSFERAQRRIATPEPPNRVFGDWLADEVWALRWTPFGSFAKARAELVTRLAVARRIAAWLDISNPEHDNVSAAEAVMIVDVIGSTDSWESVQHAIAEQ
ncbi:MAG: hypothetical protein OEM15_02265 [Myxococcales bacterium]|nr:hypothetical protein [Myxococcales bacterium]MDH3485251.1 hypothetical protein [Myxococcales bacterium]